MLQTYTFSQAQGAVRQIDALGTFFRYESGSAGGLDEAIQVRADGNDLGTYYPGDSITLPTQCKRWEVIPISVGCAGRVRIGAGRVDSARLMGTVQVIDSDRFSTQAGRAFMGGTGTAVPAAGRFASSTLWNPVTSGSAVVVEAFRVEAGAIGLGVLAGQIATRFGGQTNQPRSKLSGGAQSDAAFFDMATHATDPGVLIPSPAYWGVTLAANAQATLTLKRPIVVLPGWGLMFAARNAAASFGVSVEFTEEQM